MTKLANIISSFAVVLLLFSGYAIAEDKSQDRPQVGIGQLMTQQERLEHHEKMKNAKTAEERHQIQMQHHELMRKRAEARGEQLRAMPADKAKAGGS